MNSPSNKPGCADGCAILVGLFVFLLILAGLVGGNIKSKADPIADAQVAAQRYVRQFLKYPHDASIDPGILNVPQVSFRGDEVHVYGTVKALNGLGNKLKHNYQVVMKRKSHELMYCGIGEKAVYVSQELQQLMKGETTTTATTTTRMKSFESVPSPIPKPIPPEILKSLRFGKTTPIELFDIFLRVEQGSKNRFDCEGDNVHGECLFFRDRLYKYTMFYSDDSSELLSLGGKQEFVETITKEFGQPASPDYMLWYIGSNYLILNPTANGLELTRCQKSVEERADKSN